MVWKSVLFTVLTIIYGFCAEGNENIKNKENNLKKYYSYPKTNEQFNRHNNKNAPHTFSKAQFYNTNNNNQGRPNNWYPDILVKAPDSNRLRLPNETPVRGQIEESLTELLSSSVFRQVLNDLRATDTDNFSSTHYLIDHQKKYYPNDNDRNEINQLKNLLGVEGIRNKKYNKAQSPVVNINKQSNFERKRYNSGKENNLKRKYYYTQFESAGAKRKDGFPNVNSGKNQYYNENNNNKGYGNFRKKKNHPYNRQYNFGDNVNSQTNQMGNQNPNDNLNNVNPNIINLLNMILSNKKDAARKNKKHPLEERKSEKRINKYYNTNENNKKQLPSTFPETLTYPGMSYNRHYNTDKKINPKNNFKYKDVTINGNEDMYGINPRFYDLLDIIEADNQGKINKIGNDAYLQ